jgi:two-component system CheB/CheR fusion protein
MPQEFEWGGKRWGARGLRLCPYRTVEDKIDGIVITFVEITERRRMEEALRTSDVRNGMGTTAV